MSNLKTEIEKIRAIDSDALKAEVDARIDAAVEKRIQQQREQAIWTILTLLAAAFFVWVVFK